MKNLKHIIVSIIIVISLFLPIHWLFKVCIIAFAFGFLHLTNVDGLFKKKNNIITIFFGPPGAGKTTVAAYLAQLRHKQGVTVLSNVDISNTYQLDPTKDLGTYSTYFDGEGCSVVIDEATLDFDGRGFKSFSNNNRNYFSLFRHDCNEVFVFSQAVDCDKRIRDRANICYYLQRSIIPGFISIRKIKKMVDIDETSRQLVDGFEFVKWSRRLLWGRKYWRYFDTLDRNLCCKKERTWLPWRADELPVLAPVDKDKDDNPDVAN